MLLNTAKENNAMRRIAALVIAAAAAPFVGSLLGFVVGAL